MIGVLLLLIGTGFYFFFKGIDFYWLGFPILVVLFVLVFVLRYLGEELDKNEKGW